MNKVCLLIGTNLGDKMLNLQNSLNMISAKLGRIKIASSVYETEAWGVTNQPSYYNLALEVETKFNPLEVLSITQKIENDLGRVRKERWGARIIDIDIIFFNHEIIELEYLIVPHPRLSERKFVLSPLFEIIPNYLHPILNVTITELHRICLDPLEANKITNRI